VAHVAAATGGVEAQLRVAAPEQIARLGQARAQRVRDQPVETPQQQPIERRDTAAGAAAAGAPRAGRWRCPQRAVTSEPPRRPACVREET